MDTLSKERRSWNMSRIRSKNTRPEIKVRSLLHQMGYRFRLHSDKLPGKPDIVLPKHRTVIFVHGCFWHRHKDCKYAYEPKSRQEFWQKKFRDNVRRHTEVVRQLLSEDWSVLVVWECQLRDPESVHEKLDLYFSKRVASTYLYDLNDSWDLLDSSKEPSG